MKQLIARARFLIQRQENSLASHPDQDGVAMDLELARMALAGMEAEPVAYIGERMLESLTDGARSCGRVWHAVTDELSGERRIPLYAAPQPLTTSERAELENYRNAQQVVPEAYVTAEHRRVIGMLLGVCGAAFELADDSCQQDVDGEECHVVPADSFKKLSDALGEIENTLPDEYQDLPDTVLQWAAVPRHALQAMLQGKAEPVTTAYKLPPHVYRELVNSLRDTAVKYHGCQQLREQISETLSAVITHTPHCGNSPVTPDGWVMVPAAPTEDMLSAAGSSVILSEGEALIVYRDMLAAAPRQEYE